MKRPIIFCFLMFAASILFAQNYEGVWSGYLYVTENGLDKKLPFVVTIEANADGTFGGRTILTDYYKKESYHNQCQLKATLSATGLAFTDGDRIEATDPPVPNTFNWCFKSGTLVIKKDGSEPKTLYCTVTGRSAKGDCPTGIAELTFRGNSH